MNKTVASVAGVCVLLAMTGSALAQRVTPPPAPAASQTTQAPYAPVNPNLGIEQARPLFYIGQLPVVVWAPVQPPYSSKLNRSQATNALSWNVDAY